MVIRHVEYYDPLIWFYLLHPASSHFIVVQFHHLFLFPALVSVE